GVNADDRRVPHEEGLLPGKGRDAPEGGLAGPAPPRCGRRLGAHVGHAVPLSASRSDEATLFPVVVCKRPMANKTVIDGVAGLKSFFCKELGTSDFSTITFEVMMRFYDALGYTQWIYIECEHRVRT